MIKVLALGKNVISPNKIVKMPCPKAPIIYKNLAPTFIPILPMIVDESKAAKKAIPNENPYLICRRKNQNIVKGKLF